MDAIEHTVKYVPLGTWDLAGTVWLYVGLPVLVIALLVSLLVLLVALLRTQRAVTGRVAVEQYKSDRSEDARRRAAERAEDRAERAADRAVSEEIMILLGDLRRLNETLVRITNDTATEQGRAELRRALDDLAQPRAGAGTTR